MQSTINKNGIGDVAPFFSFFPLQMGHKNVTKISTNLLLYEVDKTPQLFLSRLLSRPDLIMGPIPESVDKNCVNTLGRAIFGLA